MAKDLHTYLSKKDIQMTRSREKMLHIISHQGIANQNTNEGLPWRSSS